MWTLSLYCDENNYSRLIIRCIGKLNWFSVWERWNDFNSLEISKLNLIDSNVFFFPKRNNFFNKWLLLLILVSVKCSVTWRRFYWKRNPWEAKNNVSLNTCIEVIVLRVDFVTSHEAIYLCSNWRYCYIYI